MRNIFEYQGKWYWTPPSCFLKVNWRGPFNSYRETWADANSLPQEEGFTSISLIGAEVFMG